MCAFGTAKGCNFCMMQRVTVGVCTKNCENSIRAAIDSIINQDFQHKLIEVLVVDGYSKDKTLQILEELLKKTPLRHKIFFEDTGVGLARQIVVENAHGDYIIWVDCDMMLTKDFVKKQVEFMDENPGVAIAKGKCGINNSSSIVAYLENIDAIVKHLDEHKLSSEVLGTAGCIYRVEAIRNVGGFDAALKAGEDSEAEDRLRKAGWLLTVSSAEYYEVRRMNWKALWNEYFWHGGGGQQVFRKVDPHSLLYRMFPPFSILTEIARSITAYKLFHKKIVFLLPFHWIFKRTSWFFGFVMCYLNSRTK